MATFESKLGSILFLGVSCFHAVKIVVSSVAILENIR